MDVDGNKDENIIWERHLFFAEYANKWLSVSEGGSMKGDKDKNCMR
jgi:hypothetical protein